MSEIHYLKNQFLLRMGFEPMRNLMQQSLNLPPWTARTPQLLVRVRKINIIK